MDLKMVEFNINVQSDVDALIPTKGDVDQLIVSSCAVHFFSDDRIWSEFEEQSFNCLNVNNWGLGVVDFEIGFSGYTGKAYPKVYTKCFVLRTDNDWRIKPMKFSNKKSESKVNQRGETVVGIRYYFKSEQEILKLISCDRLMFECFFALNSPRNVYGLMCQLKKRVFDDGKVQWEAECANTYRPKYAKNIKHLMD